MYCVILLNSRGCSRPRPGEVGATRAKSGLRDVGAARGTWVLWREGAPRVRRESLGAIRGLKEGLPGLWKTPQGPPKAGSRPKEGGSGEL